MKFSQQDIQNLCGLSLLPVKLPHLKAGETGEELLLLLPKMRIV